MKKLTFILVMLLGAVITAWGEGWSAETIEMVHLKDSTKYVCNPDGVLSAKDCYTMDTILNRLRLQKGIETVVVVVNKIEGGDLHTFGSELFNKYGIGNKKQRTGLVVTLSVGDRELRIQPGYGLEGTLPDATCKKIEVKNIDLLKEEKWGEAMISTIQLISGKIYDDPTIIREIDEAEEEHGNWGKGLAVIGVIFLLFIIVSRANARKCPKCGKKKMRVTQRRKIRSDKNYNYYEVTYVCKNCDYSDKIERKENKAAKTAAAIGTGVAGAILSGGGSSSGGSSRGGGGSFGGGSYGGGGAGTKF